ncbi:MAG: glycosyl hydrolase family 18 protein [Clostridia bacterium]
MKELNKNSNKMKKILILVAIILVAVFIFIKAEIFIKEKTDETVNLVINNNNVTSRLKNEVKIENGIIYVSKDDMKNFFDKYIYVEDEIQEVVTTYEDKIASIGFESNKLTLNGATKKISAHAIKENDVIYLPLSEMIDVYNIEINNIEDTKIIIVDSLNREQIKADIKSKVSVKSTGKIFSKTISKLQKGESVIVVGNSDETEKNGWIKVRTQNGKIGYIKANKLENITTVREAENKTKQITTKINMFWDYYSQYVKAPDRTGQVVDGVNVVSPSFFYLDKSDGTLKDNVGDAGLSYIKWAHSNGYKVWPMISNAEAGIKITSTILNSYTKRQELIESIVDKCAQYDIDGINVDFENIYEADKDKYSRFIIELVPRMLEMKLVTSVDVTAPDGDPNWSLCFDRGVLGNVADYLVFMAYDNMEPQAQNQAQQQV